MTSKLSIEAILSESEREASRYKWDGTFADYLRMVTQNPSQSRLSHSFVYDAIMSRGVETGPSGDQVYGLFDSEIFGLEHHLDRIVQHFAASSQRMEVRKRILLLLGPPASGKSSVVELIKRVMENYSRSTSGAVYTISGCPMQEEPLHLIPPRLRPSLLDQYGLYIEGDLCPRCRYVVKSEHNGRIADVPVRRVVFSEQEAVGIGYFMATNPNPSDASLLVGSVDTTQLDGDRLEVAGKAFRLDGELNVANRGLIEFVEMFKADRHLLTTLLSLAQEQLIKMERFGSVYADEVIIGHSNEGDFDSFAREEHSEALRDRIIAIQVPYNLKVTEEVKIYGKILQGSKLRGVHIAPLTLRVSSVFTVLSRLDLPERQGMTLLQKLHLYDGEMVPGYSAKDLREIQRHHTNEGMTGISPRHVMNRLGVVASQNVTCVSPLAALNSMWQGLEENVSVDQEASIRRVALVTDSVKEYNELVIRDIQKAYEESFEDKAKDLLGSYLANVTAFVAEQEERAEGEGRAAKAHAENERDMREIERVIGITERNKVEFRIEIYEIVTGWRSRGWFFEYTSEPRLRAAIESRLLTPRRKLEKGLAQPRFARQRVEWSQRRAAVAHRLMDSYDYCDVCSEDAIEYVSHVLKNRVSLNTPKDEGIEWLWPLHPVATGTAAPTDD
ncbi:MAG: protein prkA [SAR202 cluster bacterium]|nr:protein prkA [SAR202 cluster bacterium]